ncbi:putative F-box protein At1g46840 [Capsella rubella]|uniref:putative F-box protein At1g46840 n=1 Tax=Capsella rubella TaxID=81985 RepID=UPI000CD5BF29|nr:putative F-box protein At1g46840 [Capsella rubella]
MVLYRSTRRNKQSSASTFLRETLPIDLIIEILSRLPVNSIARYRFVSKQWASLLQRQDFTELFLTRTPMPRRQRLLFTFRFGSKWHYFSSPQPQDFGDNVSVVATDYDNCAELEVLDDTKEGKWSIHNCNLPYSSLEDVRKSIWASDMGDIVWPSSTRLTDPLYVYYKNVETDHVRTVEIKGLKDKVSTSRDPHESLFFFTNYDENLMFLQQH